MDIEEDIIKIANHANLKISYDARMLYINHKLNFKDKSIKSIGFFLLGGIFLIIIPFVKSSDTTSKFLGIFIGLLFLILSIITIIRQSSDHVKVFHGNISFQYNLKKFSVPINKSFKIKMKTENITINRASSPFSSTFILVTHYLQTTDKEMALLNFQLENSEIDNAYKLGNKITNLLSERLGV